MSVNKGERNLIWWPGNKWGGHSLQAGGWDTGWEVEKHKAAQGAIKRPVYWSRGSGQASRLERVGSMRGQRQRKSAWCDLLHCGLCTTVLPVFIFAIEECKLNLIKKIPEQCKQST